MKPQQTRHLSLVFASVLLALSVAGCGFGTGGIVAGLGRGSGGTNAPSTPAGLTVLDNKTSPARVRIVLTDA